jgi:hypothetical protein
VLEVYEDEGRIENFKCEPLSRDLDESGGRAVLERSPGLGGYWHRLWWLLSWYGASSSIRGALQPHDLLWCYVVNVFSVGIASTGALTSLTRLEPHPISVWRARTY